jgi:hypothetical protein
LRRPYSQREASGLSLARFLKDVEFIQRRLQLGFEISGMNFRLVCSTCISRRRSSLLILGSGVTSVLGGGVIWELLISASLG